MAKANSGTAKPKEHIARPGHWAVEAAVSPRVPNFAFFGPKNKNLHFEAEL